MEILGTPIERFTLGLVIFALAWMLFFASKEIKNRRAGGHADYKALIVSIGVLGTFIGIFIGLWNFDTSHIEASVPALLEGLKLAFATSILGMFVSVVLAGMERADAASFADEAATLASIDEKLNSAPEIASHTLETVDQLKNFRMEVRDEQMKSRTFIQEQFVKTNEALETAIETLAEGATSEIIEALEAVISDFNKNLTEQFGDNFKQLNEAVHKLVEWQENYRLQVERSTHHLEAITESLKGSDETLGKIAERNEQILGVHTHIHRTLVEQNKQLETSGAHLEAQKKNIEVLGTVAKEFQASFETTAEKISALTNDIKESVTTQSSSLTKLTEEIENQLPKTLSELDQNLAGLTRRFASDYESFLNQYQSLVASNNRAN